MHMLLEPQLLAAIISVVLVFVVCGAIEYVAQRGSGDDTEHWR
jgi:hypothetical protein